MDHDHDHDHCNDPSHHHHHHHDHASSAHLSVANRFIELANTMMQEGVDPEAVGVAMTHAAANFTAFAAATAEGSPEELDNVADEYRRLVHAYFERRREA
ncbi:MAG: DUF3144 domain-containing protein [Proteobacteria bacterium]|nr:DUF3144 domain-containing protein [Pseudomonadota bacterium]MDA0952570.1 DUF3144 domain-containing protein [Pseudomonadota bacterium]MDA1071458.1 DUF3144 domain-containing protein [Pseudomonadota bacterium]